LLTCAGSAPAVCAEVDTSAAILELMATSSEPNADIQNPTLAFIDCDPESIDTKR
jgi:hypothetical protein